MERHREGREDYIYRSGGRLLEKFKEGLFTLNLGNAGMPPNSKLGGGKRRKKAQAADS